VGDDSPEAQQHAEQETTVALLKLDVQQAFDLNLMGYYRRFDIISAGPASTPIGATTATTRPSSSTGSTTSSI
jgi:hypothetical protein